MIGSFLLLALFLSLVFRMADADRASYLARAAVLALVAPLVVLVALATLGIRLPYPVTLLGLLVTVLAVFPWKNRRPLPGDAAGTLTLAALAGITGAAGLAAAHTMHDLYAHLAWSKDLVSAQEFYPLGFPALFQLVGGDFRPLIAALRVLPAVLGVVFALQCIAIGEHFHSKTAGALAALAYMLKSSKVDPSLPEFLGVILIVATWREILAGKNRFTAPWLGLLSFALVVSHVSTLEIAHFALVAVALLVVVDRPPATRLRSLGATVLGAALGVLISPLLRDLVFGNGPLLTSQQPGQLTGLHPGAWAWAWGYGFMVALAVSGLLLLRGSFKDGRWRWVFLFAVGSAVLLSPMALTRVGIEIPLQMFTARLYLGALLFACLSWLVLVARAPRLLMAAFGLLLAVQVAHASNLDPVRTLIAAGGLSLLLLGLHHKPVGKSGWVFAALVLVGVGIRIALWAPQAPPWVTWFQRNAVPESVVLTNWPAVNPLDAMTSLRVQDGAAGADANLALHRLSVLPEYRKGLLTCDPSGSYAGSVAAVLDSLSSGSAYVVLHDDYAAAWEQYATVHASIETPPGGEGLTLYREPPCPETPSSRLAFMQEELEAHPGYEMVYEDQECRIFYYAPVRN